MKHAILIGGAGFIGSNLARRLLTQGWHVTVVDNLITGREENIATFKDQDSFTFVNADIIEPVDISEKVDVVFHLAAIASPKFYFAHPIESLRVGSEGTLHALEIARRHNALFFLTSTSEVYGSPFEHPQKESYWGHVNPIGPRSVYDESKRYAESLTVAYCPIYDIDYRIIRIFNTYGPNMDPNDGRAVPNFIQSALAGRPVSIYGDGEQTRSLCYIEDLIDGIMKILQANICGPINLGNDNEITINQLAKTIIDITGSTSPIEYANALQDDPPRRKPDITLAKQILGWKPETTLEAGLSKTINYFKELK